METVVVLLILGVVGFLAYKNKDKIMRILQKPKVEGTVVVTQAEPVLVFNDSLREVKAAIDFLESRGVVVTPFELMKKMGRGLTGDEEEYSVTRGVVWKDSNPTPGPGVDRSGFDITEAKGWIVTNTLENGKPYTFTLGKPGMVRVFGYAGNQVKKVNGQEVIGGQDFPDQSGTFTVAVESVNGMVAVQIV